MIGAKAGAAGASTKRKPATKRGRGGVAGGVGELEGAVNGKFIGVRQSTIVEIKNYIGCRSFYVTMKDGVLEAAITHDVARLHANPDCPEQSLNILKVESCIKEEAQTEHEPGRLGKSFVLEFTKEHPLKLEGLTEPQFVVVKNLMVQQGRQCFLELKEKITGDRVQGRQRKDLDPIHPYLPEGDVPKEDDLVQASKASKDIIAGLVTQLATSKKKVLDAEGEALFTWLQEQMRMLKPESQWEGLEELPPYFESELPSDLEKDLEKLPLYFESELPSDLEKDLETFRF